MGHLKQYLFYIKYFKKKLYKKAIEEERDIEIIWVYIIYLKEMPGNIANKIN